MNDEDVKVEFGEAASLKKWPSLGGQKVAEARHLVPYTVLEGSLGECLKKFMSKPPTQRHLYEIHTSPQEPFFGEIVSEAQAVELSRLLNFIEALK